MKRIILLFFIAIIVLVTSSCNKDKPPVGFYEATFIGSYQDTIVSLSKRRVEYLYIVNSFSESIDMGRCSTCSSFSLAKGNNRSITGIINISRSGGVEDVGYCLGPITIDGKWSKEKSDYMITGNFSYTLDYMDVHNVIFKTVEVVGTFEFKPYGW